MKCTCLHQRGNTRQLNLRDNYASSAPSGGFTVNMKHFGIKLFSRESVDLNSILKGPTMDGDARLTVKHLLPIRLVFNVLTPVSDITQLLVLRAQHNIWVSPQQHPRTSPVRARTNNSSLLWGNKPVGKVKMCFLCDHNENFFDLTSTPLSRPAKNGKFWV